MPTIEHDEQGGTIVLFGNRPNRWYKKELEARGVGCRSTDGSCKNLPTLMRGTSIADVDEETAKYRLCVCYAPPCCQVVYEPIHYLHDVELSTTHHDWQWRRVTRRRLLWFRLRGWV